MSFTCNIAGRGPYHFDTCILLTFDLIEGPYLPTFKRAIQGTSEEITEFVAELCGIPSWDGHEQAKLRATLPLRCTGLGIDVLDKGNDAAIAAMSSAITALCQFGSHVADIGGWTNDPGAVVNTYSWLVDRINQTKTPGTLPLSAPCTVNSIVAKGWEATVRVAEASEEPLAARHKRAYERMTTVVTKINTETGEVEQTNSYAVPKTVAEMHDMAMRRSSKIQKNVLAHANAQRAITIMIDESNNNQNHRKRADGI